MGLRSYDERYGIQLRISKKVYTRAMSTLVSFFFREPTFGFLPGCSITEYRTLEPRDSLSPCQKSWLAFLAKAGVADSVIFPFSYTSSSFFAFEAFELSRFDACCEWLECTSLIQWEAQKVIHSPLA